MRNGFLAAAVLLLVARATPAQELAPAETSRGWVRAEYLLWWVKGGPSTTPLLTTAPPGSFGVPGQPGTVELFGGSGFDFGAANGLRISAGWDAEPDGFGFTASGFSLERKSTGFSAEAGLNGVPLLASPIISPKTGQLTTSVANNTGIVPTGYAGIAATRLWGADANGVFPQTTFGDLRVRPLAGFRYLDLEEGLKYNNSLFNKSGGGTLLPGSSIAQRGEFNTRSQFYGPQLGAIAEYHSGALTVAGTLKVATGVSHNSVEIRGREIIRNPDGTFRPDVSALYVLPSNIGRTTKDFFAVIPEVGLDVGYDVTERVRVSAGYTFLYWSNVVRPGEQIDFETNTAQIFGVPPLRPMPMFNTTDFWAHGVNLGLTLRY